MEISLWIEGSFRGPWPVLDVGFRVQDMEDPLGAGEALLDRVVHVCEALDRLVEHQQRRERHRRPEPDVEDHPADEAEQQAHQQADQQP